MEQPQAIPAQYVITVAGIIHVDGITFDGEYSAAVHPLDIPDPNNMHDVLWAWSYLGPGNPVASLVRGVSIDPRYRYDAPEQRKDDAGIPNLEGDN